MKTNKQITQELIKSANITQDDWAVDVLPIDDKYARGYLEAMISQANEQDIPQDLEEFRELLIRWTNWDIWGK